MFSYFFKFSPDEDWRRQEVYWPGSAYHWTVAWTLPLLRAALYAVGCPDGEVMAKQAPCGEGWEPYPELEVEVSAVAH